MNYAFRVPCRGGAGEQTTDWQARVRCNSGGGGHALQMKPSGFRCGLGELLAKKGACELARRRGNGGSALSARVRVCVFVCAFVCVCVCARARRRLWRVT